ncbi:TMV resistance protein N-like [Punica granatum]|uniref:TMV resistance protein N-like n=1 Tax=Punica granatum TaxID=22663 RepID=A0A6P8DCG3_PUNGR|nr:TMV resistance protein N-like [Punica granatum]
MADQVGAVMKLLNVDSPNVQFVGIHGMGGIGKITLAKLVFNELSHRFEYCSFINDSRKSSKGEPTKLQTKLLVDLLWKFPSVSDNEDGVKRSRDVLRNKLVLLVLDDVDHIEQIDRLAGNSSWFGSRSRIIITTRDKSIIERDPLHKIMQFEMMEMNYYQALQLCSKQAFKEDFPPTYYLDLSTEVISIVGKLPLALEIIGSHLHGKHRDEWKENIRTLARIPHENVQKKLRLSYDKLDCRAHQIFLDISCFFNNKDKTNAMYMWEAYLGREIVCLENFIDFGKHSRLWEHKEAIAMLKSKKTREEFITRLERVTQALESSGGIRSHLWVQRDYRPKGIPIFNGSLSTEEFLAWISDVDRFFDYYGIPDDGNRVDRVVYRLKDKASTWWHGL